MEFVRARLCNHVDHAAAGPPEFSVGTTGDYLELFNCFEGDIDGSSLAARLLAKEAVVIVPAIETDVVEDAALPVEVDLVAIRALNDAGAGRQGEKVLELAAKHGRSRDGRLAK